MTLLITATDDHQTAGLGLCLVVMEPEGTLTRQLPAGASLTIGRGDGADIKLADPLVSRLHIRLHVMGELVEVEDLKSANGTRVRDGALESGGRAVVRAGEAITVGSTVMIVQRSMHAVRARRAWPHGYFEARLQEECERTADKRVSFAVVRLHVERSPPPARVAELLAPALRPADVIAVYGPDEYELLLPGTPPELALAMAQDLVGRLRAGDLEGRAGTACHPRDGRASEELLSLACERVRGGRPAASAGEGPIVEEPAMQRLYELARRAAAGSINVLIIGETGAGKEVLAEAVHRMSPRARAPLVALNCAALSDSLLESELFGHEKGAFTGAGEAKPGLLETAPGGSVLLDEIGEMPLALQAKLLRVIETRQVTRVGGLKPRAIDVRFIAATNRDLAAEIAARRFREDLYFRLNGITLALPPLRERRSEILPLARRFMAHTSAQMGRQTPPVLSPQAETLLLGHRWPGNIRELRNVIERATLLCEGGEITPDHLPVETMAGDHTTADLGPAELAPAPAGQPDSERDRVVRALAACGGNQSRAAKLLGIARSTLIERIELYGLTRPRA